MLQFETVGIIDQKTHNPKPVQFLGNLSGPVLLRVPDQASKTF